MSGFDALYQKAELIYSGNKNTPLFAIVAKNRYETGEIETAKKILDEGIALYPDYATPLYIYAKILISEGEIEQAKEKLAAAEKLFTARETKTYFEKLLKGEIIPEEDLDPILQELNEEILPEKDEAEEPENIVTETLAEVYESQGAYKEAIGVYEKLMELEPENSEKYEAKISELREKLGNE